MYLKPRPEPAEGVTLAASVKLVCPRSIRGGARALVLRQPDGRWDLPGGHLEPGEGWVEALARELQEELGLPLPEIRPMGEWLYVRPHRPARLITFYRLAAEAAFDLADIRLSDEHEEALWACAADLDGLDMPAGFRDAIRTVMSAQA